MDSHFRFMKIIKQYSLLALLFSAFNAQADEAASFALSQMSQAMNQLNYEIAFVQTSPENMDSFRYRHLKQGNKIFAQLISLDGVQQEVIQRGNLVSYFQPNAQAFTLNSSNIIDSLPAVIRADFAHLVANYDFIKLGKNRVAGRFVDSIRIVPKDDFRYQYVVFIDEENGLLLRADMLDREGNLLDQFRVVTLHIDDRLRGLIEYLDKVSMPPLLKENKMEQSQFQWQASWLPAGFQLVRKSQDVINNEVVDNALFSDGLFSFTLYVSNANGQTPESNWKQGALTIYNETLGDKEITLIGQIPTATARRIVREVKFAP